MLDLHTDEFLVFRRPNAGEAEMALAERITMSGNSVTEALPEDQLAELREESALARSGLPQFDREAFRAGHMTPVYFGSALRRFGVRELLQGLAADAPSPKSLAHQEVSGFVFKIQANMEPKHRDRVAFLRLCSGRFTRGMSLRTTGGRTVNVHNPMMFMAQDREIAEEAFPGDIIGIPNRGALRVGDSLSESGAIAFQGLPNFAPEILKRCRVRDPLKQKHLRRALDALADEGVTQCFRPMEGSDMIVGAVGALQRAQRADRSRVRARCRVRGDAL
jgi:peptide chain release factor 3